MLPDMSPRSSLARCRTFFEALRFALPRDHYHYAALRVYAPLQIGIGVQVRRPPRPHCRPLRQKKKKKNATNRATSLRAREAQRARVLYAKCKKLTHRFFLSVLQTLARLARSVAPSDTTNAAAAATGDMDEQKVCHSTTPCGWAVYVPFTRRVDYFMKNT